VITILDYQPASEIKPAAEGIPVYIEEQLAQPLKGEGERHEEITDLAWQLVGEGTPREEVFRILRGRYPKETTGKPDGELYRAIDGAMVKGPKPAATSKRNGHALPHYKRQEPKTVAVKRFERIDSGYSAEVPRVDCTTAEFLDRVFRPGETICICVKAFKPEGSEKWIPANRGTFGTVEVAKELVTTKLDTKLIYEEEAGVWIRINPLKSGDESGTDTSVSSFRHVLVEFDGRPKEDQWEIFRQSNLPIAAVIDSGGKSLHAWVRVDANSLDEFKTRQKLVYDYLGDYIDDSGNKNPSRFSRLPGVMRAGNEQHVVSFEIGAKSWEEWEDGNRDYEVESDSFDLAEELEIEDERPKQIFDGVLEKGSVFIVHGPAKTFKSYTALEAVIAVLEGTKFLPWEAHAGKTLLVDTELKKRWLKNRFKRVANQKRAKIESGEIFVESLRGKPTSIDNLIPYLTNKYKGKGLDLIVIDSIYSLLGDREENSNEDISNLGGLLHKLAKDLDAAVLFTHHHAKGLKGGRALEMASGAGAWGRFVDGSLCVSANPAVGCFNFVLDIRESDKFPDVTAFVASRDGFVWKIEDGKKVEQRDSTGSGDRQTQMLRILKEELGGAASAGDWKKACEQTAGITRGMFDKERPKLEKARLVESGDGKQHKKTDYVVPDNVEFDEDRGCYVAHPTTYRLKQKGAPEEAF
jgi:RecA-family ATPase